jgi:hypothetical protein
VNILDTYATSHYSFNPRIDSTTGSRTTSMLFAPVQYPVTGVSQVINATNDRGDVVPFSRAGFTAALSIDNAKFRVRGGELSRRAKSP